MPLVVATRAKQGPNLLSLSRIKYLGACPYGVASRSCWASQASVGKRVTPTWITFRDAQLDEEERKERPKEQISDLEEVARPDLCGVVAQKSRPPLASWLVGANSSHVLLDCSLADPQSQFEEFTPDPFRSPESVVFRHFSDQGNRFGGDLGLVRRGLGLALPIEAEELPMPARASSQAGR